MSRIEELISRVCPDGVSYIALGDVTTRGTTIRWSDVSEKQFRYIDLSSVDRVTRRINDTATISAGSAPSRAQQIVREGDVIFATTRPTQMRWAIIPAEYDHQVASTGFCVLRPDQRKVLTNFVAHLLGTGRFCRYVEEKQVPGNYPSIPDSLVRAFRIPVPPLEVQREIVRILDSFSARQADLEAALLVELEARRRQYEYYRDALLTFDGNPQDTGRAGGRAQESSRVRWMTLGDIADIGTGSRNTNESVEGGAYPFFVRSQEPLAIDEAEFDETAIITAGDGVGVGKVFHYVDGKYALHQRAYRLRVRSQEVDPKFLFHFIRHDFGRYLATTRVHSSVSSLRKPMFERYPVPVPPREDQTRIVAILDRFDALVNDLTSGLPAELRARRQQYEYYRDKLLTFPEAA